MYAPAQHYGHEPLNERAAAVDLGFDIVQFGTSATCEQVSLAPGQAIPNIVDPTDSRREHQRQNGSDQLTPSTNPAVAIRARPGVGLTESSRFRALTKAGPIPSAAT